MSEPTILTKEQIEAIERLYQHLSDGKSHDICLALASHEALRKKLDEERERCAEIFEDSIHEHWTKDEIAREIRGMK